MINLLKLHFNYLFSWKIIYISLITLLICIISFLFFSRFYLDQDLLLFNKSYYLEEYYFESINLMKIIIILYSMFLVINSFILNKYDVFILIRKSKKMTIISKLVTILLGNIVMVTFLYLIFLVIGTYMSLFMEVGIKDISIFIDLVVFGSVYVLLFTLAYLYSKGIYSLLIVFIGYFISDITTEYFALKSDVSMFAKVINFCFLNIGYYSGEGFAMYYGKIYGIALCIMLFFLIVTRYLKCDLIN